jgi:glycine cleavage system aminomethyltransferase T
MYMKILMSPRQARDKHRESTQKQTVFSGWERPTFFAESAEAAAAEPTYSWGAPYYFDAQESEHLHTREQVSVFDQTSFSKYLVQGKEALEAMQQLCAGDVDTELGKLTYTGTQPTPSIHLLSLSGPQLPHVCKTLFLARQARDKKTRKGKLTQRWRFVCFTFTGMLNQQGGYVADVTVTRLGEDEFMIVSGTCSEEYICNASEIQTGWSPRSERPFER